MSAVAFAYKAMDRTGAKREGLAKAADRAEAYRQVAAMGLVPLSLDTVRNAAGKQKAIKSKDLAHFTSQLSVLIGARLSLSDALTSIAEQERPGHLKDLISDVARRIESGQSLADAMDTHRGVFGDVYVETIRAAEKTGNLPKILEHVSEMLERQQETRQMVRGALTYPAVVVGVMCIGVTFLVGFVVPKFAKMFASRGVKLPAITQVLAAAGESIKSFWFLYLLAIGLAVFAALKARSTERGRAMIERMVSRVPVVSGIAQGIALARFARVMGLSLSSGLGLMDGLELGGRASGSTLLAMDLEKLSRQVRTGGRLSECLSTCAHFTTFAKRMISAGETSAQLPAMCTLIAHHYERETKHQTKTLMTLVEPLLIVMIALVVLVVALGIFLPMWDMVNLVK